MYPHSAEVVLEAWFEEVTDRSGQGLSSLPQRTDLRRQSRVDPWRSPPHSFRLDRCCFFFLLYLFLALHAWLGHAHHQVGCPIRLSLVPVVRRADGELGLNHHRRSSVHRHPGEGVTETRFHEAAGGRVERLPWRAQYLMHSGRCAGRLG
jgi:hypothetical protein